MILEDYIGWMHYAGYLFSILIIVAHIMNLIEKKYKTETVERIP
jgi:hypothetical protein